jgi:hypothetical protein
MVSTYSASGSGRDAQIGSTSGQILRQVAYARRCWYGREMRVTDLGKMPRTARAARVRTMFSPVLVASVAVAGEGYSGLAGGSGPLPAC